MTRAPSISPAAGTRLAELLAGLPVEPSPGPLPVPGLTDDSRCVRPGDLFLGLASSGPGCTPADRYLRDACLRGAGAALLEAPPSELGAELPVPVYVHPQLRGAVSTIAARFHGEPSHALNVLGVTGTNGKSTITFLIAEALDALDRPGSAAVMGSLGYGHPSELRASGMTTPGPVLVQQYLHELRSHGARHVAMEVSSHALDQHRVDATRFQVATFSNLTRDHLDYHGDMQRYGQAKARLFALPGVLAAVLNTGDVFHSTLLRQIGGRLPVLGYGLTEAQGLEVLCPAEVRLNARGIELVGRWQGHHWQITSGLLGRFNAENLLAALANLILLGYPVAAAAEALGKAKGAPGRMQRVIDPSGRLDVVVDYAHSPDALAQVLLTLRRLAPRRLWCVFGCGGDRDPGKRALMGEVASRHADVLVLTSDNPRSEDPEAILAAIRAGLVAQATCVSEPDRETAIRYALQHAEAGDIVLIAGKGHEDYQEIAGVRRPFSDPALAEHVLQEYKLC